MPWAMYYPETEKGFSYDYVAADVGDPESKDPKLVSE